MSTISHLDIYLHDRPVGVLVLLPGDRSLFTFLDEYIEDTSRPVLSLSFKDEFGETITATRPVQTKLPPFFSNLLPEGIMRNYLAARAGVKESREFFLLWVLGEDLPGAVTARPADGVKPPPHSALSDARQWEKEDDHLKFSLAGVQLKLSALRHTHGGLTIPARGLGGDWIVKLPDPRFAGIPENEFSMMSLARHMGIAVPEIALLDLDEIDGLPRDITVVKDQNGLKGQTGVQGQAFAVRRFDRPEGGGRVHTEDFAQIFRLYPERKYERANYRNIAEVIAAEIGMDGIEDFIRRLVFNILIGNGDMHLKNWSLIYPDRRHAALAPAYDYVSTIPYIKSDTFALNLGGQKRFDDIGLDAFLDMADKASLSTKMTRRIALESVTRFREVWQKEHPHLPMHDSVRNAIAANLNRCPLAKAQ